MARKGTTSFRVDFTGPFFERDPAKTVKDNIRDLMKNLAIDGERSVVGRIRERRGAMPYSTGWTANQIEGRVISVTGKRWKATAVVSASTRGLNRTDAIRTKAAASSIEGRFHPFRRTAADMRSGARAAAKADLAKGLE